MAARNLARTIVEGGRHRQSQADRRWANRSERRLRYGPDGEVLAGRERKRHVWKFFHDRLHPLERWIDRQVGRGWRHVHRELCAMASVETTKGRHLREHVDGLVDWRETQVRWRARYAVDDRGILRRVPPVPWPQRTVRSPCAERRALEWASGRRVIVHGDAVFWTARPVDRSAPTSPQGRRLTANEQAFWNAMPGRLRERLEYRPGAGIDPPARRSL